MVNHGLYVLKDSFLETNYPEMYPQDKEDKRPFYLAIKDDEKEDVYWFMPLSSKLKKYKTIKAKYPKSVVIAYLFGDDDSAILIQNIIPVHASDIERQFTVNNIHFVIRDRKLIDDINNKASSVISIIKHRDIVFFREVKHLYQAL